ncbi:hypothetical protein PMI16_00824 [Herbaspirillum sp. CF444]|uniref:hypothetical protein n=1 Tax=Herbaspirillum sp. CF444 TaxID=1144319 RepID=UPI0002724B89|nr:hypothetical protein [Herbaspirillum sp. CF444]EJL92672.1 hypothetical protein PMI16_00824 [Herbaspirillum sp. CF444]
MNRLSIPVLEDMDDFECIRILSETENMLKFPVTGKTAAFGVVANDFFATQVPQALFDGKDCRLHGYHQYWTVGSNEVVIECPRPAFG